jgi:hypothetical protein
MEPCPWQYANLSTHNMRILRPAIIISTAYQRKKYLDLTIIYGFDMSFGKSHVWILLSYIFLT